MIDNFYIILIFCICICDKKRWQYFPPTIHDICVKHWSLSIATIFVQLQVRTGIYIRHFPDMLQIYVDARKCVISTLLSKDGGNIFITGGSRGQWKRAPERSPYPVS